MGKAKLRLSKRRKSRKVLLMSFTKRRLELLADAKSESSSSESPNKNECNTSRMSYTNIISDTENEIVDENCDSPLVSHESDCEISNESFEEQNESDSVMTSERSDAENTEEEEEELYYEIQHGDSESDRNYEVHGRRIVEISYFINQLKSLKHEGFDCSFFDLNLISEKIEGLRSIFTFKCSVCNKTEKIRSEKPDTESLQSPINVLAVAGTIATGIGHSQLSELFSAINIPNMSNKTYTKCYDVLCRAIERENTLLMRDAACEESKLAIESGDVNENGVPVISVIVDGAWSKRSYRTNYNALSGVACIIGARTKQILYMNVKNKHCFICNQSEAVDHKCSKNWNKSSTAMEAAIIAEGFQQSLKSQNIIYGRIIGDGDSSVYKRVTEVAPYGPAFTVEKIECRNHLLRNYLNKISEVGKNKTFPIILRKKVTNSDTLRRFRNAVTKAIQYRTTHDSQLNNPLHTKAALLKKDIDNSPYHIFGEHSNCEDYFCKKKEEENLVPQLQLSGIFAVITNINKRLSTNVYSLLHNVDTNAAETYNSIVAKFVGGKRINFSLKNSYEYRCKAAAISYNTKSNFLCKIVTSIFGEDPGYFTQRFFAARQKQNISNLNSTRQSFKKRVFATVDEDYGLETENKVEDMDSETYETKSKEFLNNLSSCDREQIWNETILQSNSEFWKSERKKRITASNFGKICKLRKTTSTAKTVERLLYSTFKGNSATKFGLENEDTVISLFEKKCSKQVRKSGLIIDKIHAFLGCSPDGLVDDDALIEIKCSEKSGDMPPVESVINKLIDYCIYNEENGTISLKRGHNYYYQIQGLLQISERNICYLLVYTKGGLHVEEIKRDSNFWKKNMEKQLAEFYLHSLLPELVDSRRSRQQNIRDIYKTNLLRDV